MLEFILDWWFFTPRVLQFMSIRHNMAIVKLFISVDFVVYHHSSVV